MRVSYTTTASIATINEGDDGNQLRFESIRSLDHLAASIEDEDDKLVFKDKSTPPPTVFIDNEWGPAGGGGGGTAIYGLYRYVLL